MAYFIPSSIQKRLLRYALSRLEFFDTDALDLDRLEIGWGRKSTVELKDVSLRKAKLASILNLPALLTIQDANVALLRVTVPADLHSASIVVEIQGVDASVRLQEDDSRSPTANPPTPSTKHRQSAARRDRRAKSPPLRRSTYSPSDSFADGSDGLDAIPTPHDLAASFLAEEPEEEKEQLEAAINSRSVDLRQSVASTDSGDDGLAYGDGDGVGVGLSLPAFLADFLKGIGDRLQVMVTDVSIKLHVRLDPSLDDVSRLSDMANVPDTTLGLHIHDIKVHQAGESTVEQDEVIPAQSRDNSLLSDRQHSLGTRCVSIHGITGSLISDAATFAQLSQVFDSTNDGTSVRETANPNTQTSEDEKLPSSALPQVSSVNQGDEDIEARLLDAMEFSGALQGSSTAAVLPHRDQYMSTYGDPLAESVSSFGEADEQIHVQSSQTSTDYMPSALRRFRNERLSSTNPSTQHTNDPFQDIWTDSGAASLQNSATSSIEMPGTFQHEAENLQSSNVADAFVETTQDRRDEISGDSSDSALLESRVFSHDEAESIYMSAVHDVQAEESESVAVPGKWAESTYLGGNSMERDSSNQIAPNPNNSFPQPQQDTPLEIAFSQEHQKVESPLEEQDNPTLSYNESQSSVKIERASTGSTTSSPAEKLSIRNLLHVSEVRVWLPQSRAEGPESHPVTVVERAQPPLEALTQSEYQTIPGAYSVYAESRSSSLKSSRKLDETIKQSRIRDQPKPTVKSTISDDSVVEVSLGTIKMKLDAFTSRILIQVARKIQSTFSRTDMSNPQEPDLKSEATPKTTAKTGLMINLVSLEAMFAEAVADRLFDPVTTPFPHPDFDSGSERILFRLSLNEMTISTPDLISQSVGRFEVGQLKFGFADEDIFSFSRETRLRTSLRDVREVSDKDLSIEISQINGNREIHVATQPVKITINLQRIDNTLGSIGGLSGLIELGSSVMSDTTVVNTTSRPLPRSRTVRFDSSTKPDPEPTNSAQPRVNVKIGGAYVLLKGNCCKLSWQSSAIKLVSRNALIGIKIDDMRLSGPHVGTMRDQAPFNVRLRDTRLTYLFTPEEHDLTRLISLLTPSKDKFEDDDDFLVDTLVRQRKKGSVLRANISKLSVDCYEIEALETLKELSTEMSKMSAVTKFLPKESRPGLLTLCLVENISFQAQTGLKVGQIRANLGNTEIAQVSAPSLVALAIGKLAIESDNDNKLITAVLPENCNAQQPMLMTRMIEDELEPTIKIKLWNTCFEYSVPTLIAFLDRDATVTGKDVADDLAASIANLVERPGIKKSNTQSSNGSDISKSDPRPLKLDLAFRECALGLKPRTMPSKCLFLMTDCRVLTGIPTAHGFKLALELRKAGLLLTNDAQKLVRETQPQPQDHEQFQDQYVSQMDSLCQKGYVGVTTISAASISVKVTNGPADEPSCVDVDVKDELFVLESCADSTQTLIDTLNDLLPPTPPSQGEKYRTEVAPVEDMMASFTGDAFAVAQPLDFDKLGDEEQDYYDSQVADDLDGFGEIPNSELDLLSEDADDGLEDYFTGEQDDFEDFPEGALGAVQPTKLRQDSISGGFAPGRLPPQVQGTANKWDSANNKYIPVKKSELSTNPLKVRVRDTHIIWHLYDGYDWEQTRDTITKAVQDVEIRAAERRQGNRTSLEDDQDEESVIGDFLFNSIYIGVPVNHDPKDLSRQINRNIDDLVSETASHTPSQTSIATSRPPSSRRARSHGRKLKLNRSRRHKIAFELRGVSVDFFVFQPGGETQSSTDVRVKDFEIFDHVPTSTWKKFATYMHDAGPREDNKPMLHLEICDVRPVPELTAAELVIRVTVLPLRLHVDQDALDFITRFFEFNDDTKPPGGAQPEQPYLQRVEVRPVPVKLDYKPKKIDYAGLRSGRTTEFMNFFILDGAEFVLKHVVVYGTSGFLKLHKSLEDVWMPDVKKNQLPSVLSGLNGVRTFVNVGTGVRDLVAIPIREYRKDGRIVRSIAKGAMAFATTTGSELTRFGAKVAIGAQTALQGAEGLLAKTSPAQDGGWDDMELDPEEKRAISHYANQPTGILQGLKGAARSLERDLLVTKDIIVAISGEVRDSTTAEGAALAVARNAPTLILRPLIGTTKAISQTLMGAANTVDPQNRRRIEDKYKRY